MTTKYSILPLLAILAMLCLTAACHAPDPRTAPEELIGRRASQLPKCPTGWQSTDIQANKSEHTCARPKMVPDYIGHRLSAVMINGRVAYVRTQITALESSIAVEATSRLMTRYHEKLSCQPVGNPRDFMTEGLALLCDDFMVHIEPDPREQTITVMVFDPNTWGD